MVRQTALSLAANGLQRTSFSEVLKASGAPRGSLYHHFPGGKDELVLDALDLVGDSAFQTLRKMAERPAVEIAQAFVELWRRVLAHSNFSSGCAVVAVTVAAETPALLNRAAAIFRLWQTDLAYLLTAGGVPGDRAAGLAAMLISGCEGAVILSRAEQSMAPFELVATELVVAVGIAQKREFD